MPICNINDYVLLRKCTDRYVSLDGFQSPLVDKDNARVFSGWELKNMGYNWRQWYIAIDVTEEQ